MGKEMIFLKSRLIFWSLFTALALPTYVEAPLACYEWAEFSCVRIEVSHTKTILSDCSYEKIIGKEFDSD